VGEGGKADKISGREMGKREGEKVEERG